MAKVFTLSLVVTLLIATTVPKAYAASTTAVDQLSSVFGTPADFAAKFEASVKNKSDALIGLLIAASGFVYAIRIFY